MNNRPPSLLVGDIKIFGDLVLAPMDGYTDWPFRSICRELGSAISYTEFVKAEDVLQRPRYIQKKIEFSDTERPVFIQVYGHDPDNILKAALLLQDFGPDAIDLNLGRQKHEWEEVFPWVTKVVQEVVDVPLCIDSTNVDGIEAAAGEGILWMRSTSQPNRSLACSPTSFTSA